MNTDFDRNIGLVIVFVWCLVGVSVGQDAITAVENVAKLLIHLDESIEKAELDAPSKHTPESHLYLGQTEPMLSNTTPVVDTSEQTTNSNGGEEKFSLVLQDLAKIEDQIKDAISKANTNRQFRLVMRLRPLLSYVTHIERNMEMLRTRVVAIATLSNLAVTVTEVLDQFGDVMTSSVGLSSGIVPPANHNHNHNHHQSSVPNHHTHNTTTNSNHSDGDQVSVHIQSSPRSSTTASHTVTTEAVTTLPYTETDPENFLKKIINQERKK